MKTYSIPNVYQTTYTTNTIPNVVWPSNYINYAQPVVNQPQYGYYHNNIPNNIGIDIDVYVIFNEITKYVSDEESAKRYFTMYLLADKNNINVETLKSCVDLYYPQYKELLNKLLLLI